MLSFNSALNPFATQTTPGYITREVVLNAISEKVEGNSEIMWGEMYVFQSLGLDHPNVVRSIHSPLSELAVASGLSSTFLSSSTCARFVPIA